MKKPISDHTLETLLGDELTSSLCVNIDKGTKMWVAAGMLVQQLEAFTDSVLVRDKKPLGIIGGKDVLEKLLENPSSELFDDLNVEDIMEKRIPLVTKKWTLKRLINFWQETRRAFAVIKNEFSDYSAISAKKILEVAINCKTNLTVSDIPKKKVITFTKDFTIGQVLNEMFQYNTRRLLLEGTSHFINDRIILEKITEELKYLRGTENFLKIPASDFNLAEAKVIPEDTNISEAAKILYKMEHPYLIFKEQVLSPWDICVILLSETITDYR